MFRKRKWWHFILIIMLLVLARYFMSVESHESDRVREASEQLEVSQANVCTMDGKNVTKRDTSSLFVVTKEMKRVYICGYLKSSHPFSLTVYLYKNGGDRAFYSETSPIFLQTGTFIFDLISTDALKGGEYRAELSIMKEVRATVGFIVEK